jgi:serine/threonine protein kinase
MKKLDILKMVKPYIFLKVKKYCFFLKKLGEAFDRDSGISEYEIIQKLGEGGFGSVDLAIHKKTKEKVAIKFLKAASFGTYHDIKMKILKEPLKILILFLQKLKL